MACTVVGYKSGTFTDRRTGEQVTFAKLYVTYPEDNTIGEACEAISVKPEMLQGLQVGDQIRLNRNRYGKVVSFDLV